MQRIEVDLKPGSYANKDQLPKNLSSLLQGEYAIRFLESIGTAPTRENIEFVLRYFPLEENCVFPVWVREKVIIAPGMMKSNTAGDPAVVLNELFRREKQERQQMAIDARGESRGGRGIRPHTTEKLKPRTLSPTTGKHHHPKDPLLPSPSSPTKKVNIVPLLSPTANMNQVFEYFQQICQRDMPAMSLVLTRGQLNELLTPPTMKEKDDIHFAVDQFCENLVDYVPSVGRDFTGKIEDRLKKALKGDTCTGLFALLAHQCYWGVLHPLVRRAAVEAKQKTDEDEFMHNLNQSNTSASGSQFYDEKSQFSQSEISHNKLQQEMNQRMNRTFGDNVLDVLSVHSGESV